MQRGVNFYRGALRRRISRREALDSPPIRINEDKKIRPLENRYLCYAVRSDLIARVSARVDVRE